MTKVLLILTVTAILLMVSASHPVIILLSILTQAFTICILNWIMFKQSWLSFILFLVFLGGLMVLFVYITSLAANEKMSSFLNGYLFTAAIILMAVTSGNEALYPNDAKPHHSFSYELKQILTTNQTPAIILVMSYLLLTMVVTIKIATKYEGPLRASII